MAKTSGSFFKKYLSKEPKNIEEFITDIKARLKTKIST